MFHIKRKVWFGVNMDSVNCKILINDYENIIDGINLIFIKKNKDIVLR